MKLRVSDMLGFKSFENARILLAGVELIRNSNKGAACRSVQLRQVRP